MSSLDSFVITGYGPNPEAAALDANQEFIKWLDDTSDHLKHVSMTTNPYPEGDREHRYICTILVVLELHLLTKKSP